MQRIPIQKTSMRDEIQTAFRQLLAHLTGRPLSRAACRILACLACRFVKEIDGLEQTASQRDPFILALNHNQRLEAILLGALLLSHRSGRAIHFLTDWNALLWPGVGSLIALHEPIVITRKKARLPLVNRLKPWLSQQGPALHRARDVLLSGRSVGIFPEGVMNRDPHRLLKGSLGAAWLSLITGAPVIPAGIGFPWLTGPGTIKDGDHMTVKIGLPLRPPAHMVGSTHSHRRALRTWHQEIMQAIARLSHKQWEPQDRR